MEKSFDGFPKDSTPEQKQAIRQRALDLVREDGVRLRAEISNDPAEAPIQELPAATSESFPFNEWGNDEYLGN